MWRNMAKTAAATAAYGLLHSLLADDATKARVRTLIGLRAYNGLYRGFYNAQAIASLVALILYLRKLPDRELYRARGAAALALRTGQVACLAYAGWAQWNVGPIRFSGLDNLALWATGSPSIPEAAVGQGPSPDPDGSMHVAGPFRQDRHPLNLAATALLWLNPVLTANGLAFNAVSTAYFLYGSHREEVRLRAAHGESYAEYQRSGVPFFTPELPTGT